VLCIGIAIEPPPATFNFPITKIVAPLYVAICHRACPIVVS
jgi:hypothetical protein